MTPDHISADLKAAFGKDQLTDNVVWLCLVSLASGVCLKYGSLCALKFQQVVQIAGELGNVCRVLLQ